MINAKEVGDYIKKKRKALGMTQADLGNRLNTTCQNISKWEGGKSVPTTDMLTDLSEALRCSINSILKGEDEMEEREEQLLNYGRIYKDEKDLSGKVFFNRTGKNQVLYKDTMYDYQDNGWHMWHDLPFYIRASGDPFEYREIFASGAKNISQMNMENRQDFVSLKDLVLEEIEHGRYNDNVAAIGDVRIHAVEPDATFAQSIVTGLYESIYYCLCDKSIDRLREVREEADASDLFFDDFSWSVFTDDVGEYAIIQQFTEKYLQKIAENIMQQKEARKQ